MTNYVYILSNDVYAAVMSSLLLQVDLLEVLLCGVWCLVGLLCVFFIFRTFRALFIALLLFGMTIRVEAAATLDDVVRELDEIEYNTHYSPLWLVQIYDMLSSQGDAIQSDLTEGNGYLLSLRNSMLTNTADQLAVLEALVNIQSRLENTNYFPLAGGGGIVNVVVTNVVSNDFSHLYWLLENLTNQPGIFSELVNIHGDVSHMSYDVLDGMSSNQIEQLEGISFLSGIMSNCAETLFSISATADDQLVVQGDILTALGSLDVLSNMNINISGMASSLVDIAGSTAGMYDQLVAGSGVDAYSGSLSNTALIDGISNRASSLAASVSNTESYITNSIGELESDLDWAMENVLLKSYSGGGQKGGQETHTGFLAWFYSFTLPSPKPIIIEFKYFTVTLPVVEGFSFIRDILLFLTIFGFGWAIYWQASYVITKVPKTASDADFYAMD